MSTEEREFQPGWPAAALAAAWTIGAFLALPVEPALQVLPAGMLMIAITSPMRSRAVREALAAATPLWLFWIMHWRDLGSWWLGDDPCHLVQSLDYGLWRPYIEPVGYFLTPSLLFSLGIDLRWFGLDPSAFYLHQLLSFTLLILVLYGFLRAFFEPQPAALAVTLFVASAPAYAVASQLMNRHYLEGLVVVLVGLWLYRYSDRPGREWVSVPGALAYLAACSAKEVFVPIILLLPLLDSGRTSKRLGRASPYVAAAAFYTVWRFSMFGVGKSFTAYGSLSGDFDLGGALSRIASILGWMHPVAALTALLVLIAALSACAAASRRAAAAIVVVGSGLALPLLPVAGRLEPRHLLLPAAAVSAVVVLAVWRSSDSLPGPRRIITRTTAGLFLIALTLFGTYRSPFVSRLEEIVERHRREGRVVLESGAEGLLATEINHSHHLECLTTLKQRLLSGDGGIGFCGDLCYCVREYPSEPPWRITSRGELVAAKAPPMSCSVAAPLNIEMHHDASRRTVTWSFGPYEEGNYYALMISGSESPGVSIPIPIPREGSLSTNDPLRFVIRYDSSEGWRTYSAVHQINLGGKATVTQ